MAVSIYRKSAKQTFRLPRNTRYQRGDPVALFIPCYIEQFYPSVAEATLLLLESYGVSVVYPSSQTCCGQPAFNSGYWDEARKVVNHFCNVFKQYRWIVTPSGSCAAMCRVFFSHLDPRKEVAEVGSRVFEITEFLVDILGVVDTHATYPRKVALHIGCHTRREIRAVEQPRVLLEHIRDITICDLPDQQECCGFGGTFSVKMENLSLMMGQTKVDNIIRSGAEVVVSTDMSCLMHVYGIMQRSSKACNIEIKHITELLINSHD